MFTVQVVVFYRRAPFVDSSPPSERQVKARVSLHTAILEPPDNPAAPLTVADRPAYLHGLAANQWILLSSTLKPASDDDGLCRGRSIAGCGSSRSARPRPPSSRW